MIFILPSLPGWGGRGEKQMNNHKTKNKLQASLTEVIEQWFEANGDLSAELPYVGPGVCSIMASAALLILEGLWDTEMYLEAENMLKD